MKPVSITRRSALGAGLALAAGAALPASAQTKTLRLSHHLPPGHLVDTASKRFAELVAQGTNGAVKVDVFPAAQIAGLRQGTESIQVGTLDLVWSDFGTLGNWRKEYGFMSLPFLFRDFDHVKKVLYGPVGSELKEDVAKAMQIDILGFGVAGFRVMATRATPINKPGDLSGLKFRVPEVPVFVATFHQLKANPTPMAFGEVYTALQTGVIDGVEVPAETMWSFKIQEVAKHVSKTYHILTDVHLMMSSSVLKGLTAAQQDVIRKAAKQAVEEEYLKASIAAEEEFWGKLAGAMTAVTNPDRAAFQQALLPVWEEADKSAGGKMKAWTDKVLKVS